MKKKNWFIDFIKGGVLGTGVLPGVSVGTVGIIVNIYDKLINAINSLRKEFKKSFFVILPIAIGCIISAVILLIIQDSVYKVVPFELTALFAGFVLAGLPILWKDVKESKLSGKEILKIIIGVLIAGGIGALSVISKIYWKIDMSEAFLNPSANWWIYPLTGIVGFVAAVGCLLPGISGAMILFIFGLYQPVVGLYKGDNSMLHNHSRIASGLLLTFILLIGAIAGLFAISKVMSSLLEKHKRGTYIWVIGFIIGSFISMFVNQSIWDAYQTITLPHILIGIAILIISAATFITIIQKTVITRKISNSSN